MKLTERDKKLLLMLAYFVIIVGFGAFVFRPLIGYYMDMGDKIAVLSVQKDEMDRQIERVGKLKKDKKEKADLFRVSTEELYPMLESQEVDREITGIVVSCGMQALNLNIVMPEEAFVPERYPYAMESGDAGDIPAVIQESGSGPADTEGEEAEDAEVAEQETEAAGCIYAPTVTLTAVGSRAQTENLIDALMRDYPAIRLKSYSRRTPEGGPEETGAEMEVVALELELYMCDQSLIEQGEEG